jgi:hypothetical protein
VTAENCFPDKYHWHIKQYSMYRKNNINDFTPFRSEKIVNQNKEESTDVKYSAKLLTGLEEEMKFRFVNFKKFPDPFHPTAKTWMI